MALPTKEERIRRKKVLQAAGYSVPNIDDSWGPWWEEYWKKVITHPRDSEYYGRPSFSNFLSRSYDQLVGNTTYEREPLPLGGTLEPTDMSTGAQLRRTWNNWWHEGDPIRDILLLATSGPSKITTAGTTAAKIPQLIKSAPKAIETGTKAALDFGKRLFTGQFTKEAAKLALEKGLKTITKTANHLGISMVAGEAVNEGSKALTSKSWAENVADKFSKMAGFHIEPVVGEFTNPGYYSSPFVINGAKYIITNPKYSIPYITNNPTLERIFGKLLNTLKLGTGVQNIRYRNEIRDYLGNVHSKYSTIVPKPVVYSGNQLELARKRVLDNLEKYGIRDTDYVSWTTFSDDPNLIQLSKSIGFEIPDYNKTPYSLNKVKITMPAKTYLEHISPIPGTEASFRPMSATIFHQNDGYVGDIQKLYPEFADAHEFSHAIDWVLHNKTTTLPKTNGIHIELDNSSTKDLYNILDSRYKINLSKSTRPEINVPGLNYNKMKQDIDTQSYFHHPSELKARYEQIKNWLGITDERPLTLTEWNQAKRYYTSSVGDNNMQEFFKLVENPEEFINWASKRYFTNFDGTVARATIKKLPKNQAPDDENGFYFPYEVNHDDELPGFLNMILQQSGGKAPISETTGLTTYARPKPKNKLNPWERPKTFNVKNTPFYDKKTTFRGQDPETITAGDQTYALAHNLPGWNRSTYKGILKDTGIWGRYDTEEQARALMYDLKGQFYKKFAQQKGGPLSADEFADNLYDLTKKDFERALKRAHGGYYVRDKPTTFDVENLSTDDINKIINILTQYKNGGTFNKRSMRINK